MDNKGFYVTKNIMFIMESINTIVNIIVWYCMDLEIFETTKETILKNYAQFNCLAKTENN